MSMATPWDMRALMSCEFTATLTIADSWVGMKSIPIMSHTDVTQMSATSFL